MKKTGINNNIRVAMRKASNGMNLRGLRDEEVSFVEKMIKPMECCCCIFCRNVVYYK